MTADDVAVLARGLAVDTKAFVAAEIKAALDGFRSDLDARVKALVAEMVPAAGPKGDTGDRGPAGESGREGAPGQPGQPGPPGPAGKDGRDGAKGDAGPPGPGVDWSEVRATLDALVVASVTKALADRPLVADEVRAAVAALPPARDGRDGQPGVPGPPGEKGKDGIDGKDGVPGLDGKDGADGLGFDGADLEFDEATGYRLTLRAGDRTKSFPVTWFDYKGVWKYGTYTKGANVTKDGNLFIALQDTLPGDQPGQSTKWRLAVRRGQDGKDAKRNGD